MDVSMDWPAEWDHLTLDDALAVLGIAGLEVGDKHLTIRGSDDSWLVGLIPWSDHPQYEAHSIEEAKARAETIIPGSTSSHEWGVVLALA